MNKTIFFVCILLMGRYLVAQPAIRIGFGLSASDFLGSFNLVGDSIFIDYNNLNDDPRPVFTISGEFKVGKKVTFETGLALNRKFYPSSVGYIHDKLGSVQKIVVTSQTQLTVPILFKYRVLNFLEPTVGLAFSFGRINQSPQIVFDDFPDEANDLYNRAGDVFKASYFRAVIGLNLVHGCFSLGYFIHNSLAKISEPLVYAGVSSATLNRIVENQVILSCRFFDFN